MLGHPPSEGDAEELAAAGWPSEFAAVVSAGMAGEPTLRPASIAAWRDSVAAALSPPPPPAPLEPAPAETTDTTADPPSSRRRLVASALAAVLAGGAGYAAATVLVGPDGDEPPPVTTTAIGNGEVRVEQSGGGVTAAITGPRSLTEGTPAAYRADVEGTDTWFWLGQDSQVVADEPVIEVLPSSTGVLVITLVAAAPSGEAVVATLDVTVVAAQTATT